jgi:hypothetical protein
MAMPDVAPDPATVVLAADPGKLMNRVGTLSAIAARIAAIECAHFGRGPMPMDCWGPLWTWTWADDIMRNGLAERRPGGGP